MPYKSIVRYKLARLDKDFILPELYAISNIYADKFTVWCLLLDCTVQLKIK